MGEGADADDDARGRAHGARPHVEGRARRLHLHRVRPLQGRLPDVPHRQAAVAEVGQRQPQAPPAGRSATAIVAATAADGRAAAARRRRDRRGHAVGLHDLRLLRGRLPDRARAPAAVLPDAPAPGDDGRRVPARAEGGVRRLRVAEQPVGTAGRHARRLGARPRRAASSSGAGDVQDLDYLFYVGSAQSFDPRGPEDRARVRRDPAARGRAASRILGAAETSTGECVRRAGNEMLFQQLAHDARRHARTASASRASSPATRTRSTRCATSTRSSAATTRWSTTRS